MITPMERRESSFNVSPFTRANQTDGQAKFPNSKLGVWEVTPCNPWTIKKIPTKPIKLYVKGVLQ